MIPSLNLKKVARGAAVSNSDSSDRPGTAGNNARGSGDRDPTLSTPPASAHTAHSDAPAAAPGTGRAGADTPSDYDGGEYDGDFSNMATPHTPQCRPDAVELLGCSVYAITDVATLQAKLVECQRLFVTLEQRYERALEQKERQLLSLQRACALATGVHKVPALPLGAAGMGGTGGGGSSHRLLALTHPHNGTAPPHHPPGAAAQHAAAAAAGMGTAGASGPGGVGFYMSPPAGQRPGFPSTGREGAPQPWERAETTSARASLAARQAAYAETTASRMRFAMFGGATSGGGGGSWRSAKPVAQSARVPATRSGAYVGAASLTPRAGGSGAAANTAAAARSLWATTNGTTGASNAAGASSPAPPGLADTAGASPYLLRPYTPASRLGERQRSVMSGRAMTPRY